MAEKKGQVIVIKKIIVSGAGHHGGSWKVALADFMTALMAFFLVMWLLGQSEETKKAISDYFSTPSVIEYNFQNFGAEVTLEKLFLDLVNEPMTAFQSFLEPMDKTPNLLDFGSAKVVQAYLMDQLHDVATHLTINQDGFDLEIPDMMLFKYGTSEPKTEFIDILEKIKTVTTGLADADLVVESRLVQESLDIPTEKNGQRISAQRLLLLKNKIGAGLENNTVDILGKINVISKPGEVDPEKLAGAVRITVKQKPTTASGKAPRKLDVIFGESNPNVSVYENFVEQVSKKKTLDKKESESNINNTDQK